MLHVVLFYDIVNDRKRAKIADACLDYGLDRVQFSAFTGELSRNHQEELMQRIRKVLGRGEGVICLVPVCSTDWNNRLEIANTKEA